MTSIIALLNDADYIPTPLGRYCLVQDVIQVSFSDRDIQVRSWGTIQVVTDLLVSPCACPAGLPHGLA